MRVMPSIASVTEPENKGLAFKAGVKKNRFNNTSINKESKMSSATRRIEDGSKLQVSSSFLLDESYT